MPRAIHSCRAGGRFTLRLFEDADRVWLWLTGGSPEGLQVFWSAEGNRSEAECQRVIAIVSERLSRFKQGHGSLDDAIEIWPEGWDFWGRGIPQPIADFVGEQRYGA